MANEIYTSENCKIIRYNYGAEGVHYQIIRKQALSEDEAIKIAKLLKRELM